MRVVCSFACAMLVATASFADTGFLDRVVTVAGTTYRYQVYLPAEHTPSRLWPIVIDLHGNGAQGNDGIRQTAHFLADQIRLTRSRFPMIAVFPQAAVGTSWRTAGMQDMVIAELDATLREFHGEPARVYLTGFSMGGAGVYAIASRWPNRFAGLIAIAGPVPADVDTLAAGIRHIPIRIFHGGADERVPVSQSRQLAAALKKADAPVQYTEYADAHHGPAAEMAYADPQLLRWLLEQRRPTP